MRWLAAGVALLALVAPSSRFHSKVSAAGPLRVVAVPWGGLESNDHDVYTGGTVVLQAVASNGGDGNPVSLTGGTWDPGDGSGPQAISVSNSRALELPWTYTGADGTPFTATISVTDGTTTVTDTFRVRIKPKSLGVEVNMALDKALWANHKAMALTNDGIFTEGYWSDGNANANTASAVQGFEINGHRETGDPTKDPYADDAGRGLRYLQDHVYRQAISGITTYAISGGPGAGVTFDHPSGTGSAVFDPIDMNLQITRNPTHALFNAGSDSVEWATGSCTAPTSPFLSSHDTLLQNYVPYPRPSTIPGSTECLVDVTTSTAYDLVFSGVWGQGGSGEFHYTRYQWASVVPTVSNEPDTNGNGYGLRSDTGPEVYIAGQIIDAFVASGTQGATAVVGTEVGRTYKDFVQDLQDGYSWGQNDDGHGGWVYNYNDQGGIDSSSTGWWAVGTMAGTLWGNTTPSWVTTSNFNLGVKGTLQAFDGSFSGNDGQCGYRAAGGPYSYGTVNTASCMLQMNADGIPTTDPRWQAAEGWIHRQWPGPDTRNSIYAMYNVTKAMRTAIGGNRAMLGGDIDWYGADLNPAVPNDPGNGYARILVGTQQSDGRLAQYDGVYFQDGWASGYLSHSWGILILSTALFEQGPIAACTVDASIVCRAGQPSPCNPGNADLYATVHFDGSGSTPGDNPIASYAWDFKDGGAVPDATTVMTSATFSTAGTYNVSLTVTDTKGHASQVTCPVKVSETALPPVANAGGPYSFCKGSPSLVLNGSGSFGRGSNIVSYDWDWTSPNDFSPVDSHLVMPDVAAYFNTKSPGTYDVALRVTDDTSVGDGGPFTGLTFTTVDVKAADDLSCNQPPVCEGAVGTAPPMFPLDYGMRSVAITGVTDPNNDPVSIHVDAICQDEKTNDGIAAYAIDGSGVGGASPKVRAERGGTRAAPGNGRMYHIFFTANDGHASNNTCTGEVKVGVPMVVGGPVSDQGALWDSTKSAAVACPEVEGTSLKK